MKILRLLLLGVILCLPAQKAFSQSDLTAQEKEEAIEHLKMTQSKLMEAVEGLSEEQLNFKPSEDSWSVADCIEHIAISEDMIMNMIKKSTEKMSPKEDIEQVKMGNDELLQIITDRGHKVKTQKPFEPTNSFGSCEETVKAFKERRENNIDYVKDTDKNLHAYVLDFPFGKIDAYQGILFMSGHTARHTAQIEEVKANENFPEE